MGRAHLARSRIDSYKNRIKTCENYKSQFVKNLQILKDKCFNREISLEEYKRLASEKIDDKTNEEWINYYDNYILDCKKIIEEEQNILRNRRNISIIANIFFISLFIIFIATQGGKIIGFAVQDKISSYSENLNLNFENSSIYEWNIKNPGQLDSLKLSGKIIGDGKVKVYLDDILVLDSNSLQEQQKPRISLTGSAIDSGSSDFVPSPSTPTSTEAPTENPTDTNIPAENPAVPTQTKEKEGGKPEGEVSPSPDETPSAPNETISNPTEQKNNTEITPPTNIPTNNENISEPTIPPAENNSNETTPSTPTEENKTIENKTKEITTPIKIPKTTPPIKNENPGTTPTETPITNQTENNSKETIEAPIIEEVNLSKVISFSEICKDTCSLGNLNLNKTSYKLRIELEKSYLSLDSINYTILTGTELPVFNITNETSLNNTLVNETLINQTLLNGTLLTEENATIELIQGEAILGQPVTWIKKIEKDSEDRILVNLPQEAENIKVVKKEKDSSTEEQVQFTDLNKDEENNKEIKKIGSSITGNAISNTQDIINNSNESEKQIIIEDNSIYNEISYETPAPTSNETLISKNDKKITVTGPDAVHYENITTFSYLPTNVSASQAGSIKLYWIVNGSKIEHPFTLSDKDDDGFYDTIEWITPHLSDQTFEIIIITKAEHLDTNRTFISDIYEQVKSLDGIYSETIPASDYVRVTFEKNLTSKNDITLYSKIISGTPTIEVYEKDSNSIITSFNPLLENQYQKVLLTKLASESQDVFDLKIVGGSVKFDHIIDPTTTLSLVPNAVLNPVYNGTLTETTFSITKISQLPAGTSTTNIGLLNKSDTRTFVPGGNSASLDTFIIVNFTLPDYENITSIILTAQLNASTNSERRDVALFNNTLNNWRRVNDSLAGAGTQNVTLYSIPISSNFTSDYIDKNLVRVMAYANGTASASLGVNLIQLNISYETNIAPRITTDYPSNSSNFTSADISFNYTVTDQSGFTNCWYTNSSGLFNTTITCGNNVSATWPTGENNITIYANDTFGLTNSTSVKFIIASTAPIINVTINSPQNISYHRHLDVPLTFNVTLNTNGTVNYSLDSGVTNISMNTTDNLTFTSTLDNFDGYENGFYNFSVYAEDFIGNKNYNTSTQFELITENAVVNGTITDSSGNELNTTLTVYNEQQSEYIYNETNETHELIAPLNSTYTVEINVLDIPSVDKITFNNLNLSNSANITGGEQVDLIQVDEAPNIDNFTTVFSLNPLIDNFTNATVTFIAQTSILYKCPSWNFTQQTCDSNDWTPFMSDLIPGETYNFSLSPGDPGYGFILITNAIHLNSSRDFIENIYDSVYVQDGIWSPAIPANDYVRVTFTKNLTNENDITIYARTASGTPTIEVYEKDSDTSIASFSPLLENQYQKILLTNLVSPSQDVFDLKIVGGSVEFDHIVDPSTTVSLVPNAVANIVYNGTFSETTFSVVKISQLPAGTSTTNVGALNISDAKTFFPGNPSSLNDVFAFVNFTLPTYENISSIFVTTKMNSTSAGERKETALWNFTSGNWFRVNSSFGATGTLNVTTFNITFTANGSSNFVSGTKVIVMAYLNSSTNSDGIGIDLIQANVTSTANIAPRINTSYPVNASNFTTTNVNFNYTTIDMSGYTNCWYTNSSGLFNTTITCGNNITGINWPQGQNNITVYANDTFGLINSTSGMFTIDSIAPLLSIIYPVNSSNFTINTATTNITINYTISDTNLQACWWTNSSGLINNSITCGTNISRLWLIGENNVTIYSNDTSNNINQSTVKFTIINDTASPVLAFITQTPTDINATTLQTGNLTIAYNISDNLSNINPSSVIFYYKTNKTDNDGWRYINGTTTINYTYAYQPYIFNNSFAWNFSLTAPEVYPGTHNYDPIILHNTAHSTLSIAAQGGADLIKVRFFNVSNNSENNYFLSMFENTSVNPVLMQIIICNSSYGSGAFGNNCNNQFNMTATQSDSFNITINNSKYHVFSINVTNGKIDGLVITKTNMSFIYKSNLGPATSWGVSKISDQVRADTTQTSSNGGSSWSNSANTLDAMLLQFNNSDNFYYYSCANDTTGNQACSSIRNDSFVIPPLDTTAPLVNITFPLNNSNLSSNTASNNATINYTTSDETALSNCWYTNSSGLINNSITCGTNVSRIWLEGINNITVYANDTAGNIAFSSTKFIIDTIQPVFNHTLSNFELTNTSSFNYTINASDTGTGIKNFSVNDSRFNITSSGFLQNKSEIGVNLYYLNVSINDYANNQNSSVFYVNVTAIANTAPQITFVQIASNINPLENTKVNVMFNFTAFDANGASDLNNLSAFANFTRSGTSTVRQNLSCSLIETFATNYANYSCMIDSWYFDTSGLWNISVAINDSTNAQATNTTATFTLNQLQAFVSSPSGLTFNTITPGGGNITSNNDPLLLNNTGNYNVTLNTLQINATDLMGETNSNLGLYAGNLSVSIVSGNLYECNLSANNQTIKLTKSLYTNITNASLDYGNNSLNDNATGQRNIFFCIDYAGSELSSQAYSTLNQGSWTIKILSILISTGSIASRRKKKKVTDDKLFKTLTSILDKLKDKYTLSESETKELILNEIGAKYGISKENILTEIESINKNSLPITIFRKDLGCLENICKYLKENANLSYAEIAKLLDRNQRTIWTAYNKALNKMPEKIAPEKTRLYIPFNLLNDRKHTTLEIIIMHLRKLNMSYSEIAKLLDRDQRNIWTTYSKAVNKVKRNV